MKKIYHYIFVSSLVAVSFFTGLLFNNNVGPAGIASSIINKPSQNIKTCINQKCVAVTNQCTTDDNCKTSHSECKDKKCVAVDGPGTDSCSKDKECVSADALSWCKENNPGSDLVITADIYSNGNFVCNCNRVVKGVKTQVTCRDTHTQYNK